MASSSSSSWAPIPLDGTPVDYADVKSKDCELWLIRCPPGFDVSALDGHQAGTSEVSRGSGFELRPTPACEAAGLISAFPSAKKKRWVTGKPFARQFVVTKTAPKVEPAANHKKEWVAGLGQPLPPVPQKVGMRLRHAFVGGAKPDCSALRSRPTAATTDGDGDASDHDAAAQKKADKAAKKRRRESEATEAGGETPEERAERKATKKAKKAKKDRRASGGEMW